MFRSEPKTPDMRFAGKMRLAYVAMIVPDYSHCCSATSHPEMVTSRVE
jgi:hypothetical protein